MKQQDHLYDLVKSLSKQEVSFFRKYAQLYSKGSKPPAYVRLFDSIAKAKRWDEKSLKKEFGGSYAVNKHQLFEKLLSALREMYSHDNPASKALDYVNTASIAAGRQLYHLADMLVEKAEKQLSPHALTPPLLTKHFKMMLLKAPHHQQLDWEKIKCVYAEIQESIRNYETHQAINYLAAQWQYASRSLPSGELERFLVEMEQSRYLETPEDIRLPLDRGTAYKVKAKIAGWRGEKEKAYEYERKDVEIILGLEGMIRLNPMNLMVPLHNAAKSAISLGRLEEADGYIRQLENVPGTYGIPQSDSLDSAILSYALPLRSEWIARLPAGDVKADYIRQLLNSYGEEHTDNAKVSLSHHDKFYLAMAWMNQGEYGEALKLLAVFEYEHHESKILSSYDYATEFLRIICLQKSGMVDQAEARIRSLYRRKTEFDLQNPISFLKEWSRSVNKRETLRLWRGRLVFPSVFDSTFVAFVQSMMLGR